MLVPRKPFAFRAHPLPAARGREVWRRVLAGLDQDFLTDNQLSAWVRRDGPGIAAFHFYPLPFPHEFATGKWSFDEIMNRDSLRGKGPRLSLQATRTTLSFQPHGIEKLMKVKGGTVRERCAVRGDTVVLEWDLEGVTEIDLSLELPFYAAELVEERPSSALPRCRTFTASVRDQVFAVLSVTGTGELAAASAGADDGSFGLALRGRAEGRGVVRAALSVGYDRRKAVAASREAAARPAALFRAAEEAWREYFAAVVPHFECSNKDLEALYYYQAYVTRCNLYDIPYEPFTHPYTCPWKTGAVWQWSWNTPMDSVAERWLNDKALGAGGILLEGANGGAPNIGSYLHPLERQTLHRDRLASMQAMAEYQKALPRNFRIEAASTLAHTTPNGLLGAWEHFLCSQDRRQLRGFLEVMVEAEAGFSARELPSGLYACYFVDEFDYSLRWRPYTKGFRKADPQNMFRMSTPVAAVDYNCYLHALRERIIEAVAVLGDDAPGGVDVEAMARRNAALASAINRHLWHERDGFYYDAHPETLAPSRVKCIGAYAALYAGIASRARAEQMVAHLRDPRVFGSRYPCPSISLDTPGVDPSIITYGGDSMVTSGIWFTVVGLARYGYRELVAQYVARTVEMLTRGGPSSSYSYHCRTGKPNQARHQLAAQSLIATDLICRYVVGIEPQSGGALRVDPVALQALGVRSLVFGPYRYGPKLVTVRYDERGGHRVETADAPRSTKRQK